MQEIKIERTTAPKPRDYDEHKLGFGDIFTDHMFVMDYYEGKGWVDARIVPYGPIPLDPAAMVLHYAQEVFEGMKAYRRADGKIQLFRRLTRRSAWRRSRSSSRSTPTGCRRSRARRCISVRSSSRSIRTSACAPRIT